MQSPTLVIVILLIQNVTFSFHTIASFQFQ
jgi:hypothetical protein